MKRLLAVGLGFAFAFAVAVHAHTQLKESSPAADASVPAPKAVALTFAGDVRLTSVSLTDSAGAPKQLDSVPSAIASTFSLAVHEPLTPGAYRVVWRAVGGDTHIISGEFSFMVTAAPAR
jgi:methionine-rich copper-binding protein CopC